jgi:aminoglycoside phosphotransferase (APT) family kinase protein
VGWSPELETVFWTFPNDRKLRLDFLAQSGARIVAYAPEKSATGCWPHAYVKVYSGDEGERTLRVHELLRDARVRVPPALGYVRSLRALAVEPLAGRPLAAFPPDELPGGYRLLGGAVARLHDMPPPDGARFRRCDPDRVRRAAALLGRARPDAAAQADELAAELELRAGDSSGPPVCLHGDLHPKNVLLDGGRVGLVDLDQVAGGPPAAELGSLLAALRYARLTGELPFVLERRLAAAFLDGYGAARPLPDAPALRWHTAAALLAERALRAVNRIRPRGLVRLRPLLADARSLLDA